jgi:hypothetical protein
VSWRIADVIDFEWFLAEDGDLDDSALRARDRQIFGKISATGQSQNRKEIFRSWLEARRDRVCGRRVNISRGWQTLGACPLRLASPSESVWSWPCS